MYFEVHVFYDRSNGFSVFFEGLLGMPEDPTEEQIIEHAVELGEIGDDEARQVDYAKQIDEEEYLRVKAEDRDRYPA